MLDSAITLCSVLDHLFFEGLRANLSLVSELPSRFEFIWGPFYRVILWYVVINQKRAHLTLFRFLAIKNCICLINGVIIV